jgi:hypothetical protein
VGRVETEAPASVGLYLRNFIFLDKPDNSWGTSTDDFLLTDILLMRVGSRLFIIAGGSGQKKSLASNPDFIHDLILWCFNHHDTKTSDIYHAHRICQTVRNRFTFAQCDLSFKIF